METTKEIFSSRVDNYIRYRPTYPEAAVNTLIEECQLDRNSLIADIGSGTGIFTRHLLDKGFTVFAVEPNKEMRQASEKILSGYDLFTSISGCAEESNLTDSCVDLIVSAQAFHWFNYDEAQKEFSRILKKSGWLALVWNQRKVQQPMQQDYDALLNEHIPEYDSTDHMNIEDDVIMEMFDPGSYQTFTFENSQTLDKIGFFGRMQSSSYTPSKNTLEYLKLMTSAKLLFSKYEKQGQIKFEYDTRLYIGKLKFSEQID